MDDGTGSIIVDFNAKRVSVLELISSRPHLNQYE